MIDIVCQGCGTLYHSDEVHVGKHIRCSRCGCQLHILKLSPADDRSLARPPARTQTTQPLAKKLRRLRPLYPIAIAVGVVLLAGALLVVRFRTRDDLIHGTASISDIDEAATAQQVGDAQSSDAESQSARSKGVAEDTTTQDPINSPSARSGLLGTRRDLIACGPNYTSLRNGNRIEPDISTNDGYGVLELQNGTSEDAVLSLHDLAANQIIREVYVQAKHTVRLKGIPEGTYQLDYEAGLDWDSRGSIFRCGDQYARFERDFAFTEERDQEGVQYHAITVTLHPVVGGNIRTKKISREEFLRNDHRTASLPR
jgi:hypothetical protein